MNQEHTSTEIDAEERPLSETDGTGTSDRNQLPPPPPTALKGTNFAASAAMVNDILAAGPAEKVQNVGQSVQAPDDAPSSGSDEAPESSVNETFVGATSPDFFAKPLPKSSFRTFRPNSSVAKPEPKPRAAKPEPKSSFWTFRRKSSVATPGPQSSVTTPAPKTNVAKPEPKPSFWKYRRKSSVAKPEPKPRAAKPETEAELLDIPAEVERRHTGAPVERRQA